MTPGEPLSDLMSQDSHDITYSLPNKKDLIHALGLLGPLFNANAIKIAKLSCQADNYQKKLQDFNTLMETGNLPENSTCKDLDFFNRLPSDALKKEFLTMFFSESIEKLTTSKAQALLTIEDIERETLADLNLETLFNHLHIPGENSLLLKLQELASIYYFEFKTSQRAAELKKEAKRALFLKKKNEEPKEFDLPAEFAKLKASLARTEQTVASLKAKGGPSRPKQPSSKSKTKNLKKKKNPKVNSAKVKNVGPSNGKNGNTLRRAL